MKTPLFTPLAQGLPASVPFVGPEAQERDRKRVFKARLGANECGFGPSPLAVAAMQEAMSQIWMYGDPESYDLRLALADFHQVTMENIVVGEGIDGLLGYLVRLIITDGDAVVTSAGAYPTFNYHVTGFGGTLHMVPYCDDHEDPIALFDKAREVGAKLVYLSNPDNPMGTWHKGEVLQDALDHLPEGCLLVLDEAYIDLAPDGTSPSIDIENPSVIRMRTFSKGYGMAGTRVGYALGAAPLIKAFEKVRNHFGMNRMSQIGALAALNDQSYLRDLRDQVARSRERISAIAETAGLVTLPSATNFVTIDCGQDGPFARAVLAALIDQDVFVRMPFVTPQDRCIRVSCGPKADMDVFATALPKALAAARR